MAMSMTMQWILYGVLVVILGVVGYFLGKTYTEFGAAFGAGFGIAAGALISMGIYITQEQSTTSSTDAFTM
jgi:hypothetical protein